MKLLYNPAIYTYYFLILLYSFFNKKAKLWVDGRKRQFSKISAQVKSTDKIVWFHCSSLGEFEQGRPVIENYKLLKENYNIIVTFFSPSGYEVRKNYSGAHHVFYLPLDTPRNAKKFIELINPEIVFFVKYEYWYNYLRILNKKDIPTYLISANFRTEHIFFKWYGGFYRKMLTFFTHIFVQNEAAKELLSAINISHVTVTGDTRFDRVSAIARESKKLPLVEIFKQNKFTLIAGSTWEQDEEILIKFINSTRLPVNFIIAPHEIKPANIDRISGSITKKTIKYSAADEKNIPGNEVLIIDNIGLLSALYKYGDVAYIGGGFGKGIHNILEAAVFGMPVLFGPNIHKFQEAKDLIRLKGAFVINNYTEFDALFSKFYNDKTFLSSASGISKNFVAASEGATGKIVAATVSV